MTTATPPLPEKDLTAAFRQSSADLLEQIKNAAPAADISRETGMLLSLGCMVTIYEPRFLKGQYDEEKQKIKESLERASTHLKERATQTQDTKAQEDIQNAIKRVDERTQTLEEEWDGWVEKGERGIAHDVR